MPASSSRAVSASAARANPGHAGRANRALDALNFFLADARGGLGPYLAIYLLTVRDWNEAQIGAVMSIGAIAGLLAETPGGALIDAIRAKRALVVLAALLVTAGSLLLPFLSTFLAVALSQAAVSVIGSIFGPAIAAISLGIVGHAGFARRTGRNEAFNHSGNAFAAAVAGGAAYLWGPTRKLNFCVRWHCCRRGHRAALRFSSRADMPSAVAFCRVCGAVPLCECGNASARWSEARTSGQEYGHLPDVSLHRRGANHHGANGDIGRA